MMNSENLQAVLGPLVSDSAWRYWNLLVMSDSLVAWPYSVGETWLAALGMRIPFVPSPDRLLLTGNPSDFSKALLGRELRVHTRQDIAGITLTVRAFKNRIQIDRYDGRRDRYWICHRNSTSDYGAALKSAFPEKYQEEGVPSSFLGKLLRG